MLLLQDQKVVVQASFQVKRQWLPSNKPSLELMWKHTPPERKKLRQQTNQDLRPRVERVVETVLKKVRHTACIDVRKPECDQDSTVFLLLSLNLENCVNDLNKL